MAENAVASKVDLAENAKVPPVKTAAKTTRVRQIHKAGEVNISAYFPAEMKASLRMVQAKTGNNVKECLAEALCDLFKKHNVPVPVEWAKALADHLEQAVQAALVDRHHRLFTHLGLGVIGHRQAGLAHHGQVVGAVAHGDGLLG